MRRASRLTLQFLGVILLVPGFLSAWYTRVTCLRIAVMGSGPLLSLDLGAALGAL
jgi:hypothetical protein